jgi:hypothetical protein
MTWSYGVGWLFLVTFMFTFNFHIGDPDVIGTSPPGWVWTIFDRIFDTVSIGTDTVLATNPYAATSNTKQWRNDPHHGFVYAH